MKKIAMVLLMGCFWFGQAQAQLRMRPGAFFVADQGGDVIVDNTDELGEISNQPELNQKRFALNNQDLKLTTAWLKWKIENDSSRNFVVSPLSLYMTSLLLANGMVDKSLAEFSALFSILRMSDVNEQLQAYVKLAVKSARFNTSVWGKVFSKKYQTQMKDDFNAEIWGFKEDTKPLNAWFAEKTEQKIKKVVDAVMAADNEIRTAGTAAFYAKWATPFYLRENQYFANLDGTDGQVTMLNQQLLADYFEDNQMQALRLRYQTGDFLTVFLPKPDVDFKEFVAKLDIHKLTPAFERKNVDVFLPRFELHYVESKIKDFFDSLGIKRIFKQSNDYAKMINWDVPAVVADIYLTAGIRIDEAGGNARAVLDNTKELVSFDANRPFIFMINSGDFVGAVVKVKKAADTSTATDVNDIVAAERDDASADNDVKWYEQKATNGQLTIKSGFVDD